jgi:adenine phosphoribosyltransferase
MSDLAGDLKRAIRSVPNFPKNGIVFRDLTTLWKDPSLLRRTTDELNEMFAQTTMDKILGIEARGFIVGAPLAYMRSVGFIPARKLGKLPAETVRIEYDLEYGKEGLEIHKDAIEQGDRILIVDDLLATGGTSVAASWLVKKLGGSVAGFAFVVELAFLEGRKKLSDFDVKSILKYTSETE